MKKVLVFILVFMMTATLFVGCTTDVPESGAEGSEQTAQKPVGQEPDGIQEGTVANMIMGMDSISQQFPGENPPGNFMYVLIYDSLFQFVNGDNGDVKGNLAKDYTMSDDGLEWVINLQENVKFCNGNSLNAASVVGTFDFIRQFQQAAFSQMISYEATDEYQVTFILDSPMPEFKQQMARPAMGILDHTQIEGIESPTVEDAYKIGSGPYYVSDYAIGDYMVFTANENYWNEERFPHIETIYGKVMLDPSTQQAALQTGEMDFGGIFDYNTYETLLDTPNLTVMATGSTNRALWFNVNGLFKVEGETAYPEAWATYKEGIDSTEGPAGPEGEEESAASDDDGMYHPLENVNVRKALTMMVDMEQAVIAATGGYGEEIKNPFHLMCTYENDYVYDPAAAVELLAQEGFAPEDIVLVALATGETAGFIANIQSQLAEQGVTMNYTTQDMPATQTFGMKGEWDVWTEHGGLGEDAFTGPVKMLLAQTSPTKMFNDPNVMPQIWPMIDSLTTQVELDNSLAELDEVAKVLSENYAYMGNILAPTWVAYNDRIQNFVVDSGAPNWYAFYSWMEE